jgi:hypothetical protein
MKNEFKKMQKIAGLITENQNSTSSKKIRFEDLVDLTVNEFNASLEDIGNEDLISEEEIDTIISIDDLVTILVYKGIDGEVDAYDYIIKAITK